MQQHIQDVIRLINSEEVILTFVSDAYLPIFNLWIKSLEKYKPDNLCVVALDKKVYQTLQHRKIPSILMNMDEVISFQSKNSLWVKRVELIRGLINHNIHVIHSDADAFWLRDIRSYLAGNNSDLIFSIAYGFPKEIVNYWGFILCCGFFRIKSNERTKRFMSDFFKKCELLKDDQVAINTLLYEKKTVWVSEGKIHNQGYCPAYQVTIDVISKNIVSRQPQKGAYIYHPYLSSDDMASKVKQANEGMAEIIDF